MAINLKKGQKVSLTKDNPMLKKIRVGLGWDTNKYDGEADFDLDASAFLLTSTGKVASDADLICYVQGHETHPSGCLVYGGDNRTGSGDGDDETIDIDLSLVPANYEKIAITATIYDAATRLQNFGMVSNAYIRLINAETDEELLRFDLGEDYSIETAIVFAEIYKHGAEWKFAAVGSGFQGGLAAICGNYGVDAE